MLTTRWWLTLALAWAALAVAPGLSEPIKVAGVAGCAALVLWAPADWTWSGRYWSLLAVVTAALFAAAMALEPAVAWLGSVARAQGALIVVALLPLAIAAAALPAQDRHRVYAAAATLGAAVAVYAIAQRLDLDPVAWDGLVQGRPAATLSNASTLAGWLVLLLPLSAYLAWRGPRVRRRWLLATALQGCALLATGTRSAPLALLIVTVVAGAVFGAQRRRHVAALAVVVLALTLVAAIWRPASLQDRAQLWRAAAHAVWDPPRVVDLDGAADRHAGWRPWLGYGPDQQQALMAVARADAEGERREAQGLDADRAHQAVLDCLLERGVAGLLAALGMLLTVAYALMRRWRAAAADERGETVALAIALGSWLLHLQTSFALTGDRTLAWIWIGFALAASARMQPASPGDQARPWDRLLPWVRIGAGALLMGAALAAAGALPESLLQRLAPALAAERQYLAGQYAYARALNGPTAASASMVEAAHHFEWAAMLRRYDCDAALGAASAWVETAAISFDAVALAKARQWTAACARMRPSDRRIAQLEARMTAVAARLSQ